ncbi:MAG: FAD-dependent oxidoreductase [Terrimicrobiaceae bacterium]|nr:FAD-dependent oxidoreductase [Terrimicrobiaceae bacterium]
MERIAIIGTGISGLGCAWNLRDVAQLTLFEQAVRPGGHTNTVAVEEDGAEVPIDTGFIVFNRVTYPNLCRLFEELGVATQPGEMSFSVQHLPHGLEYNGMSLRRIFAQKRNLLRPRFYRLLGGVARFFRIANDSLDDPAARGLSVRQFAGLHDIGPDVLEYYLVPMSAALWSAQPGEVMDFPAEMLIRFFHNHGFLGVDTHHPWFTVSGGARSYVRRILERFADVRFAAPVVVVEDASHGVTVRTADGKVDVFDRVIVAAHGDQALRMLARPDPEHLRLLAPFQYQRNHVTLHTDSSIMPRRRIAWASWNYRIDASAAQGTRATTHYWMNALQRLASRRNYFVSLNSRDEIRPDSVLYETEYDHPIFTVEALRAQTELGTLNHISTRQRVYFCGSYFRYGFHEDAYWSALEACAAVRKHLAAR